MILSGAWPEMEPAKFMTAAEFVDMVSQGSWTQVLVGVLAVKRGPLTGARLESGSGRGKSS